MEKDKVDSEPNVAKTPRSKITYAGEPSEMERLQSEANESKKDKASSVSVDALVSDNRRWKDVEQELPEEDCTVDVWIPEGDYDYKRATDVHYDAEQQIFYIDYDLTEITEDVKYWIERPKPPE